MSHGLIRNAAAPARRRLLLCAGVVALSCGCATKALWEVDRFANFHEPAPHPRLAAYRSENPPDVLVLYDAISEAGNTVQRRAYFLEANAVRIEQGRKPKFVPPARARGLAELPALTAASSDPGSGTNLHVVLAEDGQSISLRAGSASLWNGSLPTYPGPSGRTKQVLLTPFAVLADLTIVGGFLFLMTLPESGYLLTDL